MTELVLIFGTLTISLLVSFAVAVLATMAARGIAKSSS